MPDAGCQQRWPVGWGRSCGDFWCDGFFWYVYSADDSGVFTYTYSGYFGFYGSEFGIYVSEFGKVFSGRCEYFGSGGSLYFYGFGFLYFGGGGFFNFMYFYGGGFFNFMFLYGGGFFNFTVFYGCDFMYFYGVLFLHFYGEEENTGGSPRSRRNLHWSRPCRVGVGEVNLGKPLPHPRSGDSPGSN